MLERIRKDLVEIKQEVHESLPMRAIGGDYIINTLMKTIDEVDRREEEIKGLSGDTTELTNQISALEDENASLESQVSTLKNEKAALESDKEALQAEVDTLNTRVQELEAELERANANEYIVDPIGGGDGKETI